MDELNLSLSHRGRSKGKAKRSVMKQSGVGLFSEAKPVQLLGFYSHLAEVRHISRIQPQPGTGTHHHGKAGDEVKKKKKVDAHKGQGPGDQASLLTYVTRAEANPAPVPAPQTLRSDANSGQGQTSQISGRGLVQLRPVGSLKSKSKSSQRTGRSTSTKRKVVKRRKRPGVMEEKPPPSPEQLLQLKESGFRNQYSGSQSPSNIEGGLFFMPPSTNQNKFDRYSFGGRRLVGAPKRDAAQARARAEKAKTGQGLRGGGQGGRKGKGEDRYPLAYAQAQTAQGGKTTTAEKKARARRLRQRRLNTGNLRKAGVRSKLSVTKSVKITHSEQATMHFDPPKLTLYPSPARKLKSRGRLQRRLTKDRLSAGKKLNFIPSPKPRRPKQTRRARGIPKRRHQKSAIQPTTKTNQKFPQIKLHHRRTTERKSLLRRRMKKKKGRIDKYLEKLDAGGSKGPGPDPSAYADSGFKQIYWGGDSSFLGGSQILQPSLGGESYGILPDLQSNLRQSSELELPGPHGQLLAISTPILPLYQSDFYTKIQHLARFNPQQAIRTTLYF